MDWDKSAFTRVWGYTSLTHFGRGILVLFSFDDWFTAWLSLIHSFVGECIDFEWVDYIRADQIVQ